MGEAVEEAVAPALEAVAPVIEAVEEAVAPVLEAVEPVVEAIVESIPEAVTEVAVELSVPLVEAVVTPDASTAVPEPLPVLDGFAPCETLGDVTPAPVEVVAVVPEVPAPEVPVVAAVEPIPAFEDLGCLAGSVLNAPFNLGALSLDFSLATKSTSAYD